MRATAKTVTHTNKTLFFKGEICRLEPSNYFSGFSLNDVANIGVRKMSCPPLVEIGSDGPEIEIVSDGELSPFEGDDEAQILPLPVPNRLKEDLSNEDLSDIRCCALIILLLSDIFCPLCPLYLSQFSLFNDCLSCYSKSVQVRLIHPGPLLFFIRSPSLNLMLHQNLFELASFSPNQVTLRSLRASRAILWKRIVKL